MRPTRVTPVLRLAGILAGLAIMLAGAWLVFWIAHLAGLLTESRPWYELPLFATLLMIGVGASAYGYGIARRAWESP